MSSSEAISILESLTHDLQSLKKLADGDPQNTLDHCRKTIDKLDIAIMNLLNERVAVANVIADVKKDLDIPVYVPTREADVIRNILAANEGPLSDEAARRLYERIIDETRSNERQRYQGHHFDESSEVDDTSD